MQRFAVAGKTQILDAPVTFFFDDVDPVRAPPIVADLGPGADQLQRPETIELVAAYYAIERPLPPRMILLTPHKGPLVLSMKSERDPARSFSGAAGAGRTVVEARDRVSTSN